MPDKTELIRQGQIDRYGAIETGSHEVRGSIPLGSTNIVNNLGPPIGWPKSFRGLLTATLTATH
jgi:hypothetical protein